MSEYLEIRNQIEALEAKAQKVLKGERSAAINEVKAKIKAFGLTASDIGLETRGGASRNRRVGKPEVKRQKKGVRRPVPPKYSDAAGNTWTGRGKRPLWVVAALAGGQSLDSLLINRQKSLS